MREELCGGLRTIIDSFRRQKPTVRALIAITVLGGVAMFVMGVSEDERSLYETGVVLSVVLPIIGLLEDRIYRKSRERYLETRAATDHHRLGLPPLILESHPQPPPPATAPQPEPIAVAHGSPWARPMDEPGSKRDADAIEWYGLYG